MPGGDTGEVIHIEPSHGCLPFPLGLKVETAHMEYLKQESMSQPLTGSGWLILKVQRESRQCCKTVFRTSPGYGTPQRSGIILDHV